MIKEPEGSLKRAQDAPEFLVDEDVGALLNTDNKGLAAYRQQRATARKNLNAHARIDRLEASIDELKQLLLGVLNK